LAWVHHFFPRSINSHRKHSGSYSDSPKWVSLGYTVGSDGSTCAKFRVTAVTGTSRCSVVGMYRDIGSAGVRSQFSVRRTLNHKSASLGSRHVGCTWHVITTTTAMRFSTSADPVRSPVLKLRTGRLVLRWVTTWDSLLLYVLFCKNVSHVFTLASDSHF
jgi:hypothetical protein